MGETDYLWKVFGELDYRWTAKEDRMTSASKSSRIDPGKYQLSIVVNNAHAKTHTVHFWLVDDDTATNQCTVITFYVKYVAERYQHQY